MDIDRVFEDGDWIGRLAQAVAPPEYGELLGYRIVRIAHRGGQGTVYEAIEPRTGRRVAIKHLPETEGTRDLRRRRETDALGSLNHPNVVRLLAAPADGTVLVMEWVEGVRLDEWADRHFADRPSPGAIRAAVTMLGACGAGVAAAHARGLLHRDLKPSNVLVEADGNPKILDFGLATALDPSGERTLDGSYAGTPAWSAPEQLEADAESVDARADIHGLGLLLYRALAGRGAFEGNRGVAAIFDDVRALVPPPLSHVRPGIPRELDLIAAKALEKDPDRRYATAEDFRRDLRRFLDGDPVEAHPPHPTYLVKKFVGRHPGATAGVALATLATIIGTFASARFAIEARASRDEAIARRAEAERAEGSAERMNALLVDLLAKARDREMAGEPAGVRGILAAAAESIDGRDLPPETEIELQVTLATALAELGEVDLAIPHFVRTEELLDALDRDSEIPMVLVRRSAAGIRAFSVDDALRSALRGADLAERLGLPDGTRAASLDRLAYAYLQVDRMEEALATSGQAVSLAERASDPDLLATALSTHALALARNGRLAQGVEAARRSVERLGDDRSVPPATQSRCHYNLGFLLTEHGRHDEAIEPLRTALEIRIGLLGKDHPKTIPARAMLSLALRHEQRFDEAIEVLEEASRVASGNGRSAAGERIRIGREFGRVYLARDQPGDLVRAEETLDGVLRELISLGPGNLRQFTPIVHALMTCIERRDGRSAAMQAAMALGERFSAGSPEMAAAIRIEAIRRFATAPTREWPDGPPIEAVRADLETIAGAVGAEGHQSLHAELVLAQLLAAREDSAEREESLARARSLRDRTERIGVAVNSVREAAESLLKP